MIHTLAVIFLFVFVMGVTAVLLSLVVCVVSDWLWAPWFYKEKAPENGGEGGVTEEESNSKTDTTLIPPK